MKFIIVEIGCLECELPSKFIGYATSEIEAQKICDKLYNESDIDQAYIYCNVDNLVEINLSNVDSVLNEEEEEIKPVTSDIIYIPNLKEET